MANSVLDNVIAFQKVTFIILGCITGRIYGQIRYTIPEEMEIGDFVGNIAEDLILNIPQLKARKARLTSDNGGQYMKVNLDNGILCIREKIDRELLCGTLSECTIPFEIILENPWAEYRGEVEVLDINDNAPIFRDSIIALQMSEAVTPGAQFPLESAEDPDVGLNTVVSYTISSNEYFSIKSQRSEYGVVNAELQLQKTLDRELKSAFQLVLTAIDGGIPNKSGTTQILITVVDFNDNPPVFDRDVYRATVKENSPQGTLVLTVKATDLDEGLNAELTYCFSKLASPKIRELFSLDPHTGDIRVEGELDFERVNSYSLNVQALDRGSPSMGGRTTVIIRVTDVNDNAPEMKIESIASKIVESAPLGTLITLINVIDRDSGENGRFDCDTLTNVPFTLRKSLTNHYELITNGPLDREVVAEYNIAITFRDLGTPSLSTNKTINVVISDVNDNAPRFAQSSYNIYIMENNSPGTSVFTVTANDLDMGQNSYVSYSFLGKINQDFLVTDYLSIESTNGTIYTLRSFDYEQLKTFRTLVQACDAGMPPLSSTTTVNVIILDQNDNSPVIVSPSAQRALTTVEFVPRAAGIGYLVTKVIATDADSGQNARLSYQMRKATDPSLFNIAKESGEVRTTRTILELDATSHTLLILVMDSGQPILSSTVIIHVTVLENITEAVTETDNLRGSSEQYAGLNLYLIIIFSCTSVLFLVVILLLIALKCRQNTSTLQGYNSSTCADSNYTFNRTPAMEETLRYPEASHLVRVADSHHYSVCLSPESAKSEFLFLKPPSAPTSRAQC